MISGIGTDLCEIERVRQALARSGDRFLERICTPEEQQRVRSASDSARELALHFALKEATFKALGRSWPEDIGFTDVALRHDRRGVTLSGRAAEHATSAGVSHLTAATSASGTLAVAVVIAERPR